MATSDVQIANQGLMRLGLSPITSLNENNDRAKAVNTVYADLRDAVLMDGNWSFALKRYTLTADVSAPIFGWDYQHTLPVDCLRVVETDDEDQPWTIEDGKLLSNRNGLDILYVKRVTDVSKYSATFVDALAERIAAELALPLTGDIKAKQLHTQLYLRKMQVARSRDSQQGTPDKVIPDLDLIIVR